jgi:2-dehydro-3-deoxyphosphooctonate aldolase (KDO 8-P synthase)
MLRPLEKAREAGAERIMLTERGATFGYNNLVSDMRALPIMREFGAPVVFDATHSLQLPGGKGESTGGQREFIPHLARAAVAAGVDGIFAEVHTDPSSSPSDAENMLSTEELPPLLETLLKIHALVPR